MNARKPRSVGQMPDRVSANRAEADRDQRRGRCRGHDRARGTTVPESASPPPPRRALALHTPRARTPARTNACIGPYLSSTRTPLFGVIFSPVRSHFSTGSWLHVADSISRVAAFRWGVAPAGWAGVAHALVLTPAAYLRADLDTWVWGAGAAQPRAGASARGACARSACSRFDWLLSLARAGSAPRWAGGPRRRTRATARTCAAGSGSD